MERAEVADEMTIAERATPEIIATSEKTISTPVSGTMSKGTIDVSSPDAQYSE